MNTARQSRNQSNHKITKPDKATADERQFTPIGQEPGSFPIGVYRRSPAVAFLLAFPLTAPKSSRYKKKLTISSTDARR
jgi:hypothetical protein